MAPGKDADLLGDDLSSTPAPNGTLPSQLPKTSSWRSLVAPPHLSRDPQGPLPQLHLSETLPRTSSASSTPLPPHPQLLLFRPRQHPPLPCSRSSAPVPQAASPPPGDPDDVFQSPLPAYSLYPQCSPTGPLDSSMVIDDEDDLFLDPSPSSSHFIPPSSPAFL